MRVKVVPRLNKDIDALKHLEYGERPSRRQMRAMRQVVDYLMGDSSGMGFGSIMWYQSRLVSEAVEFTPMYQVRTLNFREEENVTKRIVKVRMMKI